MEKEKYLKILEKFKSKSVGIFIDEANLFYSQKDLGWHIDWQKVLKFFKQFYDVKIIHYYMGMPFKKESYEQNILIKNRLENIGFEVITKPLKKIYLDGQKKNFKHKCNFDVEITRDVIRNLEKIDMVLLISSDSDFLGLRKDVLEYKKGFVFVCFENNVAWEIRKSYHLFFEDIKDLIQYDLINKTSSGK
ncbi:MAG: NYN domain-containing protein [bacterium]